MRMRPVSLGVLVAGVALAASATALAGEPPNQNDPCGKAGRNTCGTTGVGSYQRYRYGVRWFGDYRGAVAEMGRAATFCLDLRYWYPGRQFKYAEVDPPTLRNRDGKAVSGADLSRMSYAIWNFGRGNARNQAAATMLYVHGLMDDGAPGEVAKDVLGPTVEGVYDRIQRDADRYRGPYRLAVDLPARLTVGKEASGTVRVTSATGAGVPGVKVTLASADAAGLTRSVTTNAKGQASFDVTASAGGPLGLRATTEALAAARPRIFSPTVAAAARNGQRLAAPQGDTVEQEISRPVGKGTVAVTSRAFPRAVPAGGNSRDRVTITGGQGLRTKVGVALYGPFPTKQAVRCDAAPVATSSFDTNGKETYTTAATAVQQPGWYTYVISVPDSPSVQGVTTPCGEPSETFRVYAKPTMTSQVSTARLRPNEALSTAVTIKGLSGQTVPISVELFGPYASAQDATTCQTPPLQTQTLTAAGDGTYSTDPVTLTTPGYYAYRESSAGTELAMKSEIACGDPLETAVVVGSPKVVTQVSAQELVPGGTMHDTLVVTGLGPLKATINLELWGPYQSKAEMVCSGKPAWSGTIQANGDGTYTSPDVRVNTVGYYTYRERIAEAPQNDAELGACGEAAETTIVKAAPDVVTQVSNAVVRPGGTIFDRLKVTGAGTGALDIELELFGPFPTKAAVSCAGAPYWKGTVAATKGDGTYTSPRVRVEKAGFYTYRERIAGSAFVAATQGQCGESAETSLGAPAINTGRGAPPTANARASQAGGDTPRRLRIANLGIDTPVAPVGIDLAQGALDVPKDILRAGWWRDGAAPGDGTGSVLIAGHVDSARRGAGAFFRLKNARAGMRVVVTTAGGASRAYRVTTVRAMPKASLPLGVYAATGRERLTLVTCGGPFDRAIGHYKDNIVVTAVPVR